MGLSFHRQRHEKARKAREAAQAVQQAPEPVQPEPTPEPNVQGHTVKLDRGWYRLIDPDGVQVGTAKRTESEAWAILGESGGG